MVVTTAPVLCGGGEGAVLLTYLLPPYNVCKGDKQDAMDHRMIGGHCWSKLDSGAPVSMQSSVSL